MLTPHKLKYSYFLRYRKLSLQILQNQMIIKAKLFYLSYASYYFFGFNIAYYILHIIIGHSYMADKNAYLSFINIFTYTKTLNNRKKFLDRFSNNPMFCQIEMINDSLPVFYINF